MGVTWQSFMLKKIKFIAAIIAALVFLSSCLSTKKISSFTQLGKNGNIELEERKDTFRLNAGDQVKINLVNADMQTLAIFSNFNTNGGSIVTNGGFLEIPIVGIIMVKGVSEKELKLIIERSLIEKSIANQPFVEVIVVNKSISVLGEVYRPGKISYQGSGLTLTEALSEAGDLTNYAKRSKVLLIRQEGNQLIYTRFNMNDSTAFNKEVYFLRNKDIIYVEPNSAKAFNSSQSRAILGFITGVITLYLLIISLR